MKQLETRLTGRYSHDREKSEVRPTPLNDKSTTSDTEVENTLARDAEDNDGFHTPEPALPPPPTTVAVTQRRARGARWANLPARAPSSRERRQTDFYDSSASHCAFIVLAEEPRTYKDVLSHLTRSSGTTRSQPNTASFCQLARSSGPSTYPTASSLSAARLFIAVNAMETETQLASRPVLLLKASCRCLDGTMTRSRSLRAYFGQQPFVCSCPS